MYTDDKLYKFYVELMYIYLNKLLCNGYKSLFNYVQLV